MNYLELINKCLVELNYKQVYAFSELTKNDHKKIKNIINVLNTEICNSDKWYFLLRQQEVDLPANTGEIENTVNGRIATLYIDGAKFEYTENFEKFLSNSKPKKSYTVFDNKIMLPEFDTDKVIKVVYYTKNHAKTGGNVEKLQMEEGTDVSNIPEPFVEPLLVYGTCMRLKGNPQHIRFNYWYSMYKDALSNLRAKISVDADSAPAIKLFRR